MNASDSSRPGPRADASAAPRRPAAQEWEATMAQTSMATQIMQDRDSYLDAETLDVGRRTATDTHELFVSCDAAQALQQQFEHLRPDFIAVHDIGTRSSHKLLVGIAAASSRTIQKLVIRRQGFGTALASIDFVELPTPGPRPTRMYSTAAETDETQRLAVSRMLLAFSRVGVIMVGELPSADVDAELKPLHDCMVAGPWPNRHLLLLPLASAPALITQGADLGRGSGVNVRTTPQVSRPADAWSFINATWNRIHEESAPTSRFGTAPAPAPSRPAQMSASVAARSPSPAEPAPLPRALPTVDAAAPRAAPAAPPAAALRPAVRPAPAAAPVQPAVTAAPLAPLPMRPMPQPGADDPTAPLDRYVRQLAELAGMVSCCVFDVASGRPVAQSGAGLGAMDLATHGTALLNAISASSRALGLGHTLPEVAVTLGDHHLLLRAVPRHPGLALHAVLDKAHANLTLARLQVLRMDSLLDAAPPEYAERRRGPRAAPAQ